MSDVEVCNLAYRGQLDELKSKILADKAQATRTDQVCLTIACVSPGVVELLVSACYARLQSGFLQYMDLIYGGPWGT